MGFISPLTITGRSALKQLWCVKGQKWDAPVPDEIEVAFLNGMLKKGISPTSNLSGAFLQSAMCAVIHLRAQWIKCCKFHS